MKFKEQQLKDYAQPLSATEIEKCKNAIRMVRDAMKETGFIDDSSDIQNFIEDTFTFGTTLRNRNNNREVKLFLQGSFANNTNVKNESDVDIAIILESTFRTKYRDGITGASYGYCNSSDSLKAFKDDVQLALEYKFGNDVERKNKSIKINGNTYRVNTDTVPCMRYKDYSNDYSNDRENCIKGIVICPDSGGEIINYPELHIQNGKAKNNSTNYLFKKMVRIMKKMRYLMQELGYPGANKVSSFGLESLLWNIPDEVYAKYPSIYRFTFDELIKYVQRESINNYKEANGIKKLFPTQQILDDYKRFIDDINTFYEYDIKEI
ncbi:MAG: nucleotidyltransferase [Clostridia bacterium]|jgi:hypothetical protein